MTQRSNDAIHRAKPKASAGNICKCAGCGNEFEVKVRGEGPLPISGALGIGEAVFVSVRGRLPEERSFFSSPFTCPRCGLAN